MMQTLKEVNVCIPAVPKSFSFFFFFVKTFKAEYSLPFREFKKTFIDEYFMALVV